MCMLHIVLFLFYFTIAGCILWLSKLCSMGDLFCEICHHAPFFSLFLSFLFEGLRLKAPHYSVQ